MSTMLERLARHVARPVEECDRRRAMVHLGDWLACVAGGRKHKVAVAAQALNDPLATANLLGNVMEMDDVHRMARLHPGPVIWPTVLRVAADRTAMLDSALAGYETMIVIGEALDEWHYGHWHPTATAGIVGAAAAAGRAMGLDERQLADALGHAASLAGGLWHMRHGGSMTKQVHLLHASESGIRCARMAAVGLTGAVGVLEGAQGLFDAMCQDPGELYMAEAWRMREVSFKPWAACRHAHPAIDAARTLADNGGDILVETYRDAIIFCDNPDPATPAEARFSLQHSAAVSLTHDEVLPEHFERPEIARLADLRRRIRVAEDPELTARYPAHFTIRMRVGDQMVELPDTLGDPERPLSEDQHRIKLETLCAWGGLPDNAPDQASRAMRRGPPAIRDLLAQWLA